MVEILKQIKTKSDNNIVLLGLNQLSTVNPPARPPQLSTLIVGCFHGDEPQGKFLIENYIKTKPSTVDHKLSTLNSQLSTLLIPCLNPDGLAAGVRTNANGVDLNRNFPAANWQLGERTEKNEFWGGQSPASEIETQFLISVIEEYKPKLILTLHAPFKVVNYDGPARESAEKIAQIIGYPVEKHIGYPTPGSFGIWAGVERGIPTITLELDDKTEVTQLVTPVNKIFDELSFLFR
jgi:protein MpaA